MSSRLINFFSIRTDCDRFGVERPDFKQLDEIQSELEKQELEWSMVEQFNTEVQKFNDEEWIVFRKQIYRFNDFLTTSEDSLLKQTSNPLSTTLLKEVQKYKVWSECSSFLSDVCEGGGQNF